MFVTSSSHRPSRARAFALAAGIAILASSGSGITGDPDAARAASAGKKKACKKTQRLRKGKCVTKPKAKTKPKLPASAAPAPDMSDADGDGIPYAWETPVLTSAPTGSRCTSKQRLRKGKCVPRCKKGRVLKRGKCVKRKKPAKRRKATAQASIAPVSVASLGADPNHKDIFVQINYASEALRQSTSCSELDALVAAFANAPVPNPDGTTGIALHIDAGISCPSRSYNLGGSPTFDAGPCPDFGTLNRVAELPESRVGTFHVAAFGPTCGQGGNAAGTGTLRGTRMTVFTDGPSFAHILMHELGHNLGLDHPFPGQPNRISTMNSLLAVSDTGNGFTEILDYQRFSLPAIDENNLSEEAGISAPPEAHRFYIQHFCAADNPPNGGFRSAWPGDGPIDWNCNSPSLLPPGGSPTIDPGTVAADVNGDGQLTVLPATGPEWPTLDYASGGQIGPR